LGPRGERTAQRPGFELETLSRDGFGRRAVGKVAGKPVRAPAMVQVVTAEAPAAGSPELILQGSPAAAEPAGGAVRIAWGPSPLFAGAARPARGDFDIELPSLVPKAFALGDLVPGEDRRQVAGMIGAALPSKSGSAHLAPLGESCDLVSLLILVELRGRPREWVRAVAGARQAVGPRPILFAHAVADPASVSLLAYMGADWVDDFQGLLAASAGVFLYSHGDVRGGTPGACHCEACTRFFGDVGSPAAPEADEAAGAQLELESGGADDDDPVDLGEGRGAGSKRDLPAVKPGTPLFVAALGHNRRAIAAEVAAAARAIDAGTLRELVESRVRAYPWLVAALRNLDREFYPNLEALTPIWKSRLHALSHESLARPEVRRWMDRMKERYVPPPSAKVLVLVPCSARKPYSLSRTQRAIDRGFAGVRPSYAIHRAVVTSPLGLVPQELERVFPAAHYDIPVTGDWAREEERRVEEQLLDLVSKHDYKAVISLVGDDLPKLQEVVGGLIETAAKGKPGGAAIEAAAAAAREALKGERDVSPGKRATEDIASIARFQFGGPAGALLCEGAVAKGRPPWNKLFAGTVQLAQHVPDRGRLSLTLEGAKRIAQAETYRVFVEPFKLKGDVFAVGVVKADPEIRAGDEVAVVQNGDVTAAGTARMAAQEMTAMRRGVAVAVRHLKDGGRAQ
jgi:archaeosine synthase